MATDDPTRNLLPTFRRPDPSPTAEGPETGLTPVVEGAPTKPPPAASRLLDDGYDFPSAAGIPRSEPSPADTRTGTSSTGKPSTAEATALMVGVVALVATGAAFLIRWRLKATLRQPNKGQRADIAAPLARIALRHADLSWLNKDLADILDAGAATGAYVNDGPLLLPLHPDAGIPDNLQENPA